MKIVSLTTVAPLATDHVRSFDGERPYIATGGLNDEESISPEIVTYEGRPSRADLTVQTGDVCFARMKETLKILHCKPDHSDLLLSTGFAVLRPLADQLNSRYLFHYLRTPAFQNAKDSLCSGATQKAITNEKMNSLKIPLPSLEEQKRIAAMLDKADELRRKRRESLAALDSLAQSIFLDLFGDPVTNPKKWPVSGIEHVCELIVDCVNRTAPIVEEPTPFKMIRTTNVKEGKVNLTEVRYVTEDVFNRWNRRTTPQRGDVLLTREAPVGESGIIESDDNVFLGQRLMLYRANRKRMIPAYLLASFRSAFLQHQFDRHNLGSTVKHLPLPVCRNFQVLVPPIALQNEFAKRCAAIQTQRTRLLAAQSETENLFTALQQKAFAP